MDGILEKNVGVKPAAPDRQKFVIAYPARLISVDQLPQYQEAGQKHGIAVKVVAREGDLYRFDQRAAGFPVEALPVMRTGFKGGTSMEQANIQTIKPGPNEVAIEISMPHVGQEANGRKLSDFFSDINKTK